MTAEPPPLTETGVWRPDLFKKQNDVLYNRHRFQLVSGGRKTGKSIAICHKICAHLWNTNGAKVGLFTTSYKVATDGGSWTDLIDYAIPQWRENVGNSTEPGDDPTAVFEFTTFVRGAKDEEGNLVGSTKLDAKSRTPFFKIRNRFGGESECRLFSLDNENEIAAKTKQLRFSAVWVIELSTFKTRNIFNFTIQNLRAHGVAYEDHFWISDTNPAIEGEEHWAWQLFYHDRTDPDYPTRQTKLTVEEAKDFQKRLSLIEILLDDNVKLNDSERVDLIGSYESSSPDEYEIYVDGKWPKSGTKRMEIFSDLLTPIHFPHGKLDVHRQSETLYSGWDLGNTNSAAVIIDVPIIGGIPYVSILEEVCYVGQEISTKDFTLQMLDKMIAINEHYKKIWYPTFPGFKWRHWSDTSSLQYKANIGDVDASIVYKETNGQIELVGVDKSDHTVEDDLKLIRMFLREKRLFVGDNCPQIKECLQKIRKGTTKAIDPKDKHKHVLDALRYALRSEILEYLTTPDRVIDPKSPPQLSHFSIRGSLLIKNGNV